jgi:peptidoglycan/LPS O-acetylase OafA/YrhL
VGRHSYPIYLWHMPFKTMSDSMNTLYPSGLLYLTTYLIAPMVVGVAMSKWIEAPMLRLRDRLLPSRS